LEDINFYHDHFIKEDLIAIYVNEEEFVFEFNWNYVRKGI
jgi:hypothetical protein